MNSFSIYLNDQYSLIFMFCLYIETCRAFHAYCFQVVGVWDLVDPQIFSPFSCPIPVCSCWPVRCCYWIKAANGDFMHWITMLLLLVAFCEYCTSSSGLGASIVILWSFKIFWVWVHIIANRNFIVKLIMFRYRPSTPNEQWKTEAKLSTSRTATPMVRFNFELLVCRNFFINKAYLGVHEDPAVQVMDYAVDFPTLPTSAPAKQSGGAWSTARPAVRSTNVTQVRLVWCIA